MRFLILALIILLPIQSFAGETEKERVEILWIQDSENTISVEKIMKILKAKSSERNKGIYLHLDGPNTASEKTIKMKSETVTKAPQPSDTPASLGILGSLLAFLIL
tara:strand:- start:431 stop:748 length:318 start_codon:yes stop_codon:yes gene_type:complete